MESGSVFSTTQPAAARVKFTVAERCLPISGGESCGSLTSSNRNAWPDVPFDQICAADKPCTDQPSPSFFTRKRLTDVTTQVYDGAGSVDDHESFTCRVRKKDDKALLEQDKLDKRFEPKLGP